MQLSNSDESSVSIQPTDRQNRRQSIFKANTMRDLQLLGIASIERSQQIFLADAEYLIQQFISSLTPNALVFRFGKQQAMAKSFRNLSFLDMDVVLMSNDFFKRVPNLFSHCSSLSN